MTQTATNHDANRVMGIEEISPLPGRIESLEEQRAAKVADYQACVEGCESAFGQDKVDEASEMVDTAETLKRDIDALSGDIKQCHTELSCLVIEKLTEARTLFKRLGNNGNGSGHLNAAAEHVTKAKQAQEAQNLTAALLQANQALSILKDGIRKHISSRISCHRNNLASL